MKPTEHLTALSQALAERGYIVQLLDVPARLQVTHTTLQHGDQNLGVLIQVIGHDGEAWFAYTNQRPIGPCTGLARASAAITKYLEPAVAGDFDPYFTPMTARRA